MNLPCLCTNKVDIRCDATSCDLARIGGYSPDQCRVCWLRINGLLPALPTTLGAPPTFALPPPLEESKWPLLAKAVAKLKRKGVDKGLGDTLARVLNRFGAEKMKKVYKRITGRDCGCVDRQASLNQMFPY